VAGRFDQRLLMRVEFASERRRVPRPAVDLDHDLLCGEEDVDLDPGWRAGDVNVGLEARKVVAAQHLDRGVFEP
jgi:hypothetical protein